ncbi:MAG: AAA family ATPase [Idiomarina sp.]|nr:AAA family ATPase [Idiomarina sp.]
MAYQPRPANHLANESATDDRDPGLAIPTKITTSQQSVLDQLHNHVAFSETLIFLSGPVGAGKSTILEVFLEQASDYANLAFSAEPGKGSADALRTKLLRQLVSLDAYSTDDSLLEALQRNIKPGRQHLVICIDNGPSLPGRILSELQELVSSRHLFNPEHRVSVVIAGESGWVKRASKGVALGNSEPPVLVEVPAFFKREQQWFARKLIATQQNQNDVVDAKINALDEAAINDLLNQTQGFPGQIQAQLEDQLLVQPYTEKAMQARNRKLASTATQATPAAAKKLTSNQLVFVLVGLAAIIAIAVAAWLHTTQDNEPATVESEPATATFTPPILPTDEAEIHQESEDTTAPVMDYQQAMQRLRERADTQPPPRDIQFQLVQPVNYLQNQAQEESVTTQPDAEQADEPPTEEAATEQSPSVDEEEEVVEAENLNPWLHAYDNLELWQRDANRYVFQVAAFNSEPRLMQFLAGFEHPEMAIYQTLRDQQPWYMVVIGDFTSANAAQAYLASNDDLQSIQPWLKAVRLVHQDLAPVMNNSAQDNN